MLFLSNLAPIGVRVSFRRPNKHSLDLASCKFWMSSRDRMVDGSIIIEPSGGWKVMRRECRAKEKERASSMCLSTFGKPKVRAMKQHLDVKDLLKELTYSSETTCGVVIAINGHLDGLDVLNESQLLHVLQPG